MVSWLASNLSEIIGILGLGLTVYFAWGAKSAAEAAQRASDKTRLRLGKIEASDLIQDCIFASKSTIEKIEADGWDLASFYSTSARRGLVSLRQTSADIFDKDQLSTIDNSIIQFKLLTDQVDKIRLTNWKTFKKTNFVSSVNEQIDALIAIQEHVRKRLGDEA